uniref:Uncharacterized protein n=1 Tax=Bostrychia simpliciuscula TaxID=324754 RepID=A0A1Z1M7W7_9FLOR|nr:hypothetical protein [Bostrychia simpliciuscula]ARW62059.1 hypothetical protein [Bostrychia simpliciuscula]
MTSVLKSIYENQYDEYDCDNYNLDINEYEIDIPIGWSFLCFDETINYYKNCNNRTSNIGFME